MMRPEVDFIPVTQGGKREAGLPLNQEVRNAISIVIEHTVNTVALMKLISTKQGASKPNVTTEGNLKPREVVVVQLDPPQNRYHSFFKKPEPFGSVQIHRQQRFFPLPT